MRVGVGVVVEQPKIKEKGRALKFLGKKGRVGQGRIQDLGEGGGGGKC